MKALVLCAALLMGALGGGCGWRNPSKGPESMPVPLASAKDPKSSWLSVLDADLIVRVRMDFQGEPLTQLWGDETENYRTLDLPLIETIKSSLRMPWHLSPRHMQKGNWAGKVIRVVLHVDPMKSPTETDPVSLCKRFDGQELLLFLKDVGDASGRSKERYLFLEPLGVPVQPWSEAMAATIRQEHRIQAPMADYVRRYLQTHSFPQEPQVKALIEGLMDRSRYENKQMAATYKEFFDGKRTRDSFRMTSPEPLAQLELLGMDALPAIIKCLEDPRVLPGNGARVKLDTHDHPGAKEGISRADAKTVTDILNMALAQITLESPLGFPKDPAERSTLITAWRLWMVHSGMLQGLEAGKSPSRSVPEPTRGIPAEMPVDGPVAAN